jgi:selenocysteine lyase/cysteine desulfurase
MNTEIPFEENQHESSFIDLLADVMFGTGEEVAATAQKEEKDNFIQSWKNEFESLAGIAENFPAKEEPDEADNEEKWQEIRKRFGFNNANPVIIPMNAANLCPEPDSLITAANNFRFMFNKDVAMQQRMGDGEWVTLVRESRRILAEGLGIESGKENNLAILRNASEGNNVINGGYQKWTGMENVINWEENHPTNNQAWELRQKWGGGDDRFEIRRVTSQELDLKNANRKDEEIARCFTRKINDKTRFISISETSNGTGERIPPGVIKIIWEYINGDPMLNDCHFHIDATMAYGAGPINQLVKHCHSLVSSCHKWFLGPKETGILYMDPNKAEDFVPLIFAYDYQIKIPNLGELPRDAMRFELIGQRDDANLITLALTQTWWNEINTLNPGARVVELANYLKKKLEDNNWDIITPYFGEDSVLNEQRSRGIVRVRAPRSERNNKKSLYEWIYESPINNVQIAGGGGGDERPRETFRLCPHIYNLMEDIDKAVDNMNAWRDINVK